MPLTLNKQTINLTIDKGTTFEKVITAKNTAGGNVTISTGTCAGKVRQSPYSANNVLSFTTAVAGSNVTVSLTATQTATLPSDRKYLYDIEYTQSGGVIIERLSEGVITVNPRISGAGG